MSLILDALSRSDKDTTDQPDIPDINANHEVVPPSQEKNKLYMLVAIAALIFVIFVLLLVLVFKKGDGGSANVQRPANTPTTVLTKPTTPTPIPNTTTPTPPTKQENLTATTTGNPTSSTAHESAHASPAPNIDAPVVEAGPKSAVEQLYTASKAEPKTKPRPIPRPTEVRMPLTQATMEETQAQALAQHIWDESELKPLPRRQATQPAVIEKIEPKEEIEYSIKKETDVPFLHKLSVSVQNTIPTLMYADHYYADGYAIINKQKVLIGDFAAEKVTLEELREDGAIFSMGDIRFKLSAQSSWVNY